MNLEEWRAQIKRGTLEYAILLLARQGPCSGYEMMSRLARRPILAAGESTIYPLLRRLLKDGRLSAFWQETAQGLPPRKYYCITPAGLECLEAMEAQWAELLAALKSLEKEEEHEDGQTAE